MLRSPSLRRSHTLGVQRKLRSIEKCQFVVLPQYRDANNNKVNLGYGGPALDAQAGSTATADTNDPTYVGERGLRLPGVTNNSAGTPDAAAISVTGSMELIAYVDADDWTPSAAQTLFGKWILTGNQRAYHLQLLADGTWQLELSDGGDAIDGTGAYAATLTKPHWIKCVYDAATPTSHLYYSDDPPSTDEADITWTLGTTDTVANSSIFDSTALLFIGAEGAGQNNNWAGQIKRAIVKNGIDGTVVFDADFTKVAGGATSFTEDSSNAATVTINQSGLNPARIIDGPTDILDGTDDYFEIANETKWTNLPLNPEFGTGTTGWDLTNGNNVMERVNLEDEGITLEGLPPGVTHALKTTYVDNVTLALYNQPTMPSSQEYFWGYYTFVPTVGGIDSSQLRIHDSGTYGSATGTQVKDIEMVTGKWVRTTTDITPDAGDLDGTLRVLDSAGDATGGVIYCTALSIAAGGDNPYRSGSHPLGRWTGTAHASTSESRSNLDALIDTSFMALYAGRTYDTTPASQEAFIGKKLSLGTTAGWALDNLSGNANVEALIADGTAAALDQSPGLTAGDVFVVAGRRDVASDEIEAFLDGNGSGSPTTDATTATLVNDRPLRIGANGGTTIANFAAGEHFGSAFRNVHDGPAPTDAEVAQASRELAAATGRSIA